MLNWPLLKMWGSCLPFVLWWSQLLWLHAACRNKNSSSCSPSAPSRSSVPSPMQFSHVHLAFLQRTAGPSWKIWSIRHLWLPAYSSKLATFLSNFLRSAPRQRTGSLGDGLLRRNRLWPLWGSGRCNKLPSCPQYSNSVSLENEVTGVSGMSFSGSPPEPAFLCSASDLCLGKKIGKFQAFSDKGLNSLKLPLYPYRRIHSRPVIVRITKIS